MSDSHFAALLAPAGKPFTPASTQFTVGGGDPVPLPREARELRLVTQSVPAASAATPTPALRSSQSTSAAPPAPAPQSTGPQTRVLLVDETNATLVELFTRPAASAALPTVRVLVAGSLESIHTGAHSTTEIITRGQIRSVATGAHSTAAVYPDVSRRSVAPDSAATARVGALDCGDGSALHVYGSVDHLSAIGRATVTIHPDARVVSMHHTGATVSGVADTEHRPGDGIGPIARRRDAATQTRADETDALVAPPLSFRPPPPRPPKREPESALARLPKREPEAASASSSARAPKREPESSASSSSSDPKRQKGSNPSLPVRKS
jgi:hypothetical protein